MESDSALLLIYFVALEWCRSHGDRDNAIITIRLSEKQLCNDVDLRLTVPFQLTCNTKATRVLERSLGYYVPCTVVMMLL